MPAFSESEPVNTTPHFHRSIWPTFVPNSTPNSQIQWHTKQLSKDSLTCWHSTAYNSISLSRVLHHHHLCPLASLCSSFIRRGGGPSHICRLLLASQGYTQDKCDINSNCWSHQRSYYFTHGRQGRVLPFTLRTQPAHYNDQKLKGIIIAVKSFSISTINFSNRGFSLPPSNQTSSGGPPILLFNRYQTLCPQGKLTSERSWALASS